MFRAMPDDAGGARNEQRRAGSLCQCRARKGGSARAILGRIVICAHLARIFDRNRCIPGGEEVHDQVVRFSADRTRCRSAGERGTVRAKETFLAPEIEVSITLEPIEW